MPLIKTLPPLAVLEEWFHLDEETGVLTYIKRRGKKKPGDVAGWKQLHSKKHWRHSVAVPGFGRFLRARLVWKIFYKEEPPAYVDHKDRNSLNDAPSNLLDGSHMGWNNRNKSCTSASGYMGVFPSSNKDGRWQVTIQVQGKTKYVGTYEDPEIAHAAYLKAREALEP